MLLFPAIGVVCPVLILVSVTGFGSLIGYLAQPWSCGAVRRMSAEQATCGVVNGRGRTREDLISLR
jgi:hypothetical protein